MHVHCRDLHSSYKFEDRNPHRVAFSRSGRIHALLQCTVRSIVHRKSIIGGTEGRKMSCRWKFIAAEQEYTNREDTGENFTKTNHHCSANRSAFYKGEGVEEHTPCQGCNINKGVRLELCRSIIDSICTRVWVWLGKGDDFNHRPERMRRPSASVLSISTLLPFIA